MEHNEDKKFLSYFRKARQVSADWKVLGVFLEVPINRLNAIQQENHSVDSCIMAMLHEWMKGDHDSKEKLEVALKEVYSHPEKHSKPIISRNQFINSMLLCFGRDNKFMN